MIQEDDLAHGTAKGKVLDKDDCSKWMGVSVFKQRAVVVNRPRFFHCLPGRHLVFSTLSAAE
jgi:hypothetical protein